MKGRCNYEITVEKDNREGKWRFKEITGNHNHRLILPWNPTPSSLIRQEAPLPVASTSSRVIDSKKRSISKVSTGVAGVSAALEALPPPPKFQKRFMGPSLLEPEPRARSLVDQSQFSYYPSDLVSFLKSFDSQPSTLLDTLSGFQQLGISSLEVLTTLLSTRQTIFQKFLESVDGVTRAKLEEIAFELRQDLNR